ncbi:MAG: methyl-accepting chemotaxis protein [Defluviitaleaceae bacterium]|nr:methyl-accepting chemotaxis protein [Defluviitaleaceae bacterium]
MTWLRNMKIAGKLAVGFSLLVVITVIIAAFAIVNMQTNNSNVENLQDFPSARNITLGYMSEAIMDLRRINANMTFRLGDGPALSGLMALAETRFAEIYSYIDSNMQSFRDDPQVIEERRQEGLADLETLRGLISRYENEVIRRMYIAAREGLVGDAASRVRVEEYLDLGSAQTSVINALFQEMRSFTETTMYNRQNEISDTTSRTMIVLVVLTIAGIILAVVIAIVITQMITKPVSEVVSVLDNVSAGNFNINMKSDVARDEIGVMTGYVYTLVNIVRGIVDDISKLSHEVSVVGDIDYSIEASKYSGGYKEMIESLNQFKTDFVDDIWAVLGALGNVNKGDFNASLKKLPGKKAAINENVDGLMSNLKGVGGEIDAMINSLAVKGEVNFQIDTKKWEGNWRDIMAGLNDIAKAVEAPVSEIGVIMGNLSRGDFSKQVSGNYKGDFMRLKDAVNTTMSSLSEYIKEIDGTLTRVANGDLTSSITREYVGSFSAIKDSLNNISRTLNKTMSEISSASEQVLSGAKQISASAMDLANGASTQASSVEELNASVDLINQQTKQNADNATEANSLSETSTANAREGNDAMQQTLGAMNQIKDASNNISKIIRTIQDIAFQTNLLALNAAVEAARAGEHGRGFAVVAEEVRSLAARSQTAASETTELIGTSINTVETGSEIAQSTAETLNTIVDNANKVLDIVGSISNASQEQAEAISQVVQGLQQISQVVQANSAVSQEAAAAAEELNSQAEVLQQLVSYFKV